MPRRPLSDEKLAAVYGTHRRQIGRWRDRGIDVLDPAAVLAVLTFQARSGSTFHRLIQHGGVESARAGITQFSQSKI